MGRNSYRGVLLRIKCFFLWHRWMGDDTGYFVNCRDCGKRDHVFYP